VPAQGLQELQKKATDFTLANGLHFIVLERHESPVVSFHTWVNVGSVDDPAGQTGLAHMLEHMAFKGTETLGTRNWPEEKKALDAVEEAYDRKEAEAKQGIKAHSMREEMLRNQLRGGRQRTASVGIERYRRVFEDGALGRRCVSATSSNFSTAFHPTAWNFGSSWNRSACSTLSSAISTGRPRRSPRNTGSASKPTRRANY
jgi:hypothetical protein